MKTKVFCIGFHKTGTSSLAVALKTFGYRVTGPNGVNNPNTETMQSLWPMHWWLNTMPFRTTLGQ